MRPTKFNCGDQGNETWRERAAVCAELLAALPAACAPGATLADVGCGDGKLRAALLQRGVAIEWHGYDLHPQGPGVAAFDVRTELLPRVHTVAALLGVLEYLPDLPGVLARVASRADFLVVSHVVRDDVAYPEARRRELGWVQHLAPLEAEQLLAKVGTMVLARRRTPDRRTNVLLAATARGGRR